MHAPYLSTYVWRLAMVRKVVLWRRAAVSQFDSWKNLASQES